MRRFLAAMTVIAVSGAAVAQPAPPPANSTRSSDPAIAAHEEAVRSAFAAMPDTEGTGPYKAIKEVDPGLPDHVIYRPRDLAALGSKKLGVLVWGNGGCSPDGASARQHLAEIASHGYVAVAPGKILNGPGITPPPPSSGLGVSTTTAQVLAGLTWALAENARPASRYYHRIDPALTAVSGTSCGGLQAIEAAADPRIHAIVVHNSGIFADNSNPIPGLTVNKSMLLKLHMPVIYILGGPTDVAYPNGMDDFRKIAHVPAMVANIASGHGGTLREPNGGVNAQVALHWLEWQLRGDAASAKWFTGKDCVLCTDRRWTIERKGIN